jgi:LPXTG-site transpeptidase (sortase) family protein
MSASSSSCWRAGGGWGGTDDVTVIEEPLAPSRPIDDSTAPPVDSGPPANETSSSATRDNPVRQVAATAMIVLTALVAVFAFDLFVIGGLHHRSAQKRAFDTFRYEVAQGTAPLGQTDRTGHLLALGTPVALLNIPEIHVHEVVGEGTTGGVLMDGPGHRRDTPLPGQAGTSVVFGRAAAYGGPFRHLHELQRGMTFTVTTGQGTSTYSVIDTRGNGAPAPPPVEKGKGRIVLETATGLPFVPGGVLRVDADLTSQTFATPASVISTSSLPSSEQALGTDTSTVWALVLWLEALILAALAMVWSWHRWGRHQTWIVLVPLVGLISLYVIDEFMRLLPNLL